MTFCHTPIVINFQYEIVNNSHLWPKYRHFVMFVARTGDKPTGTYKNMVVWYGVV
jgi:hypothetical protein